MIDTNYVNNILKELSEKRPIFYSEADFQFSLAMEIRRKFNSLRLEWPFEESIDNQYLDILIIGDDSYIPIELKYKTKRISERAIPIKGELYHLKDQGAQDISRYHFLKDIQRVEILKGKNNKIKKGFVIFLTNDEAFWEPKKKENSIDKEFLIHNRKIPGNIPLKWNGGSSGTTTSRPPLILNRDYTFKWEHYSNIETNLNHEFKYLLVEI